MTKQRNLLSSILFAFWISTVLTYLSFSSASMPIMQMGKMDSRMAHHRSDNYPAMPCCEVIVSTCVSLVSYASEFASFSFIKEKHRIANATLASQLIFLDILSPPPKA